MIKGCCKSNKYHKAFELFSCMKQSPASQPNLITYNCILDVCVKNDDLEKAAILFQEIYEKHQPDLISYSTMIKGHCRTKNVKKAFSLLTDMISVKIIPDEPIFNLILDACANGTFYQIGLETYNLMLGLEVFTSAMTFGIMIKVFFCPITKNRSMVTPRE